MTTSTARHQASDDISPTDAHRGSDLIDISHGSLEREHDCKVRPARLGAPCGTFIPFDGRASPRHLGPTLGLLTRSRLDRGQTTSSGAGIPLSGRVMSGWSARRLDSHLVSFRKFT